MRSMDCRTIGWTVGRLKSERDNKKNGFTQRRRGAKMSFFAAGCLHLSTVR
jgi:hypothetical protein